VFIPSTDKAKTIEALRALIAQHEPSGRIRGGTLRTGLEELDEAIGGWASPGVSELVGRPGSGRLSLLLPVLARLTRSERAVALVDPLGQLHPPGLRGVRLDRLLIVQSPCEQAGWASEQLAGSGSFDLVVHLSALRLGRSGQRLSRASERGGCSVVVVSDRSEQSLSAALRLTVLGRDESFVRLRLGRCRGGRAGQELRVRARA